MNVRKVLNRQFGAVNIVSNTTNPGLTTFQLVTRFLIHLSWISCQKLVTVIGNEKKQKKGNIFVSLPSQMYFNIILVCHWIVLVHILMTELKFYFISAIFFGESMSTLIWRLLSATQVCVLWMRGWPTCS